MNLLMNNIMEIMLNTQHCSKEWKWGKEIMLSISVSEKVNCNSRTEDRSFYQIQHADKFLERWLITFRVFMEGNCS
jgi:hypothetical protein